MTSGPGSLLTTSTLSSGKLYAPFDEDAYGKAKGVWAPNIYSDEWRAVLAMTREQLIAYDPLEPSPVRKGGFRVWDAAIGIPACGLRTADILPFDKVQAYRNTNSHWLNVLEPSVKRSGLMDEDGNLLRPTAPYTLDLKRTAYGWKLRNMIHAMAHLSGDDRPARRLAHLRAPKIGWHNNGHACRIGAAILYDLPFNVSCKRYARPGFPDLPYGIEIKSSSFLDKPVLKMPWATPEAMIPDVTMAVVLATVFTEGPPYGYIRGTGQVGEFDLWALQPSLISLVGWEMADVITHQALADGDRRGEEGSGLPTCYAMHGADLLGPEWLWHYLARARMAFGSPMDWLRAHAAPGEDVDKEWRYFHEFVDSPDYQTLIESAPPLPCEQCWNTYKINPTPKHKLTTSYEEDKEWGHWRANEDKMHAMLSTAVIEHERKHVYPSIETAKAARRRATANHNKKMAGIKKLQALDKVIERMIKKGRLTLAGEKLKKIYVELHSEAAWKDREETVRQRLRSQGKL